MSLLFIAALTNMASAAVTVNINDVGNQLQVTASGSLSLPTENIFGKSSSPNSVLGYTAFREYALVSIGGNPVTRYEFDELHIDTLGNIFNGESVDLRHFRSNSFAFGIGSEPNGGFHEVQSLFVDTLYVSGEHFTTTTFFDVASYEEAQLIENSTGIFAWGTGSDQIVTVNVGGVIPEPSNLSLITGTLLIAIAGRRPKA